MPLTLLKILVVTMAMTAFFASLRTKNTSPKFINLFIPHSLTILRKDEKPMNFLKFVGFFVFPFLIQNRNI